MFLIWQICSQQQENGIIAQQQQQPQTEQNKELHNNENLDYFLNGNNDNNIDFNLIANNKEEENNRIKLGRENEIMASASSSVADFSSDGKKAKILVLNVKYRHVTLTVQVATDSSVAELKTTALKKFQIFPTTTEQQLLSDKNSLEKNYRLIYCGCPLNEKAPLQDLKLENGSHLHVIKIDPESSSQLSSNNGFTPTDYFIYCPVCKNIQASKLRTKCIQCLDLTSFLIDRNHEPQCREDVLSSSKVIGHCSNLGCKSTEAKFIFECKQKHPHANSVPLKHIRNNSRCIICITCEEVRSPIIVFSCDQQHTMCLNCFKIYSIICLNERRFQQTEKYGYSLPCPAHCPNSHIEEAHHFHILGPEEYERFKNFGTEEFIINEGGVLCPNPKCGQGILPDDNINTIICYTCQHSFCRMCSFDSHSGACGNRQPIESSELASLANDDVLVKCQWEKQALSLIAKITKACPKCNVKTEKNGGCNHMYCSRCQEEWCWICVKAWNRSCMEDHWLD